MVVDGTIARADVASGFTAPFSDTADYARAAPAVDSVRVAAGSHRLQGKDTTGFVRTGQADAITGGMMVDGTVTNSDISNSAAISDSKLAGTGTVVTSFNADLLDGSHAAAFVTPAADYGRSGVAASLYEGTSALASKYVDVAGDSMTGVLAVLGQLRSYDKICLGPTCANTGTYAFVIGYADTASGDYSLVSGGRHNTATRMYATASGGRDNIAGGQYAAVGGGYGNNVSNDNATIGGGYYNLASGDGATVGGGKENDAKSTGVTIGGGRQNCADASDAVVGGGYRNYASGLSATVGGGEVDSAKGQYSTIAGGYRNTAKVMGAAVGGGRGNTADAYDATIGGGLNNYSSGAQSTVGGGEADSAKGQNSTVSGGNRNAAKVLGAAVGGGRQNIADGYDATVAGGYQNSADNAQATVSGGEANRASGNHATIPGGFADTCAGIYALAAGRRVRVSAAADYTLAFGYDFTTTTPYAVIFYHTGQTTKLGVGVTNPTHNIDVAGGAYCNGTQWVDVSSRELKKDIAALSPEDCQRILTQLLATEVVRFRYKTQPDDKEHVGLIAEDAPAAVATAGRDGIAPGDAIGFLFAALQAQQQQIDALKAEQAERRE
jgi:hypothetical protein